VITEEPDWQLVEAPPRLDAAAAENNTAVWGRALSKHCLLDLSGVREIDSAGVGLLLHLHKHLRANGRHLVLIMPGGAVEKALAVLRLESFFLTALDPLEARWRITAREEQARGGITAPSVQPTLPWLWQGEITTANAAGAWRRLRRPLRHLCARHHVVPVDLANVRFLDSTGVRVLLKAQEFAAQRRVELQYLHWRPAVGRAVRLAGLDRLLDPSAR
jgi:anti-anti-sigma factor